jgi:hypothetical protein
MPETVLGIMIHVSFQMLDNLYQNHLGIENNTFCLGNYNSWLQHVYM